MRLPPRLWNLLASRKTKVALALAPFVLCLLVLLVYFGASWWGKSQAERLLRDMESAGYAVDPEKYWVPAADPQDDLFMDTIFQQELGDSLLSPLMSGDAKIPNIARRRPRVEPSLARLTDLARWFNPPMSDDRAAAEFLLKERHDAVMRLEELQPVLSRSKEAVWPVTTVRNDFTEGVEVAIVVEPMIKLRSLSETVGEIAIARLVTGDGKGAAKAVAAMVDITRLEMDPKPSVVSVIVADVMLRQIQAVIWEGGMRGVWSDEQLKGFDQALATLRPQQAAVESYLGEIAQLRSHTRWCLAHYKRVLPEFDDRWRRGWTWDWKESWERAKNIASGLRPPGLELAAGVKSKREYFELAARFDGTSQGRFTRHDLVEFRRMRDASDDTVSMNFESPGVTLNFVAEAAFRSETIILLTRIGIAMERYRLRAADGSYPASLEALVPDFLPEVPLDPLSGKPFRYQFQADGSPHVWSVGGNLTDDGGRPHRDFKKGDVIWITRPIPGFTERDFNH